MMFSQKLNIHKIIRRLAKALIRLRVCAGWSEPLLIAHTTLLETSCHGSYTDFWQGRLLSDCSGHSIYLHSYMHVYLVFFFSIQFFSLPEPNHEKIYFKLYENKKGTDRCAHIADRSAHLFTFSRKHHANTCYINAFSFLASLCNWAGWFESSK